jgi:exopolysaccharide production protein ExoQ
MPLMLVGLCTLAVLYLLYRDAQENPDISGALWVPLAWMFLAGSRYVSSWISLGSSGAETAYDEGSPLDAAVFATLIIAGLVVLSRRRIDWGQLAWCNKLLACYLAYCLISLVWSDEPAIGLRRWIKDMGNPIMALIIVTERRPVQAIGVVLRRLAYLMLPMSVVFVRYFPELGRTYHFGVPTFTGIGHQKNALGQMCLVTGVYFAWQVLQDRSHFKSWHFGRRLRLWVLVAMGADLLRLSDSQTSISTLLLATGVMALARLAFIARRPSRLVDILVCSSIAFFLLDSTLGLRDTALDLMGRDPSLTSRTDLWAMLLKVANSPLLGTGFMSFWAGDRMMEVWAMLGQPVLQAHSGYLEQYLNLGYVGVAFIVLLIAKGLFDARALALSNPSLAALRLAFVVAAAAYNYTEASFYGINNMWVLLLLGLLNRAGPAEAMSTNDTADSQPQYQVEHHAVPDHSTPER